MRPCTPSVARELAFVIICAIIYPVSLVITMLALPAPAQAQTLIEVRAADTRYRYADWNYTTKHATVVDLFYVGVPGSNEFNVGGGYAMTSGHLVVTPLVYAVAGKEGNQRGIKVAVLVAFEHAPWKMLSFFGHYIPVSGTVSAYQVLDALDLTHMFGTHLEAGVESSFFHTGGAWNQQTGPLLKVNDSHGAWALSYRIGSTNEFRVGRVLTF